MPSVNADHLLDPFEWERTFVIATTAMTIPDMKRARAKEALRQHDAALRGALGGLRLARSGCRRQGERTLLSTACERCKRGEH